MKEGSKHGPSLIYENFDDTPSKWCRSPSYRRRSTIITSSSPDAAVNTGFALPVASTTGLQSTTAAEIGPGLLHAVDTDRSSATAPTMVGVPLTGSRASNSTVSTVLLLTCIALVLRTVRDRVPTLAVTGPPFKFEGFHRGFLFMPKEFLDQNSSFLLEMG